MLEIHSPYVAAAAALSVPRSAFGIRTFVWHADFIDTTLGIAERRWPFVRPFARVLEPAWAWVRTIARACDATFAASRWQTEKLRAHGVARVELLPFGVEKEIFHPGARDEARRAELLAGRKGPLLLAIGRFAVEKRWDVVLDAFLALGDVGTLVVLGDGPERAAMEARVAPRKKDVTFLGFDTDRARLAATLASGDLLVHGCPFETFGLGVAEAVACGLPLVSPDEGGAAEQAETAGDAAVRYRSGDAAACAAAIREMLARAERDPAALHEACARAAARVPSVRDHFAALVARYEALLRAKSRV